MNLRATIVPFALLMMIGSADATEIGGRYHVVGVNPDGSNYAGTVEITVSSDTNCTMVWTTGAGQVLSGICMRGADGFDGAFATKSGAGLVVYRVLPDGTLKGTWTIMGQQGAGTETLTPERAASPPSDAPVTSNPPASGRYDTGIPDYTHERVQ